MNEGRSLHAVIFDWGGTLTPWHDVDLPEQWRVYAREVHGVPVFDTVAQAVAHHGGPIDGSVVTVPPAFTKDAVFEAIENGIKLIVIVTERIPRGDVAQMVELATLRGAPPDTLPKGLDPKTFDLILTALRAAAPAGLSAAEVGARTGTSRVTARRYLEHLADAARVVRSPRYGGPGRPEVEYRPASGGTHGP